MPSPLSGTRFFHLLTWFISSLPSGHLLDVTSFREVLLYKIIIPWPQSRHPLSLTCFHQHPTHYALTCTFLAGVFSTGLCAS